MNQHLTEQQLIDYQFKLASEPDMTAARAHLDECDQCRQRLQKLVRKFASLDLLRDEIGVSEDLLSKTVANATQPRGMGILPMRHRAILLYRLPAAGAVAAAVMVGVALLLVSNSRQDNRIAPTMVPSPLAQSAAPASSADQDYAFRKDQPASPVVAGAEKAEPAAPSKPSSLQMSLAEAQPGVTSEPTGRAGLAPPEPMSAPGASVKAESPVRSVPVRSGEGVPPLRVEGILPSNRGQDARDTKNKAETASPQTPDGVTTNALDAATRMAQAPEIAEQPPFAPASAIELVVLPRRENVQLTIYNGADLTLVRERRNLTLKRGWNWLQFMWGFPTIDPTSLALEPLEHRDAVEIQELVFPARLGRGDLTPEGAESGSHVGRWLIHSEVSGRVPFEVTYFTRNLTWRAFYMGMLSHDERTMHLEGYVRIGNDSGEDYENAQVRLLVGQVHLLDDLVMLSLRAYPYGPDISIGGLGVAEDAVNQEKDDLNRLGREALHAIDRPDEKPKEIRKEGLSEYFLYTIEGTETIPNEWGKRLLSFQTDGIPVISLYKYDEERWGGQTIRFLSFANDEEHKLGKTPIPDGTVRIYGRAGEEGHLSYVGAMAAKYIPVGEEIELNLGPARLVEVKPVLMDYRIENHAFDNRGNVSGWDEVRTWRIEIANTRPLPVDIEVTRGFGTPYWTLKPADASASYEKYDATHTRFKLMIEPRTKRVFEYTVTTYHGVRQEALSNAK